MDNKPNNTGLQRIVKATGYSLNGLRAAFRSEAAIRQEAILCAILIPIALLLDVSPVEKWILIAPLILVFICELVNSAIEAVVDRIGPEHHELSGKAKDIGSATVFIALAFSTFTWLWILA